MQLHLSDANRYRDQLKTSASIRGKKGQASQIGTVEVTKFMSYEDNSELHDLLRDMERTAKERASLLRLYEDDYYKLRQAIIKANRGAGIEDVLLRVEELNREKTRAEECLTQLQGESVYELDQLLQVRSKFRTADTSGYRTVQVYMAIADVKELEAKVKALTKELEQLRRQLNHLNATTVLEIELSAESCEKLGL